MLEETANVVVIEKGEDKQSKQQTKQTDSLHPAMYVITFSGTYLGKSTLYTSSKSYMRSSNRGSRRADAGKSPEKPLPSLDVVQSEHTAGT